MTESQGQDRLLDDTARRFSRRRIIGLSLAIPALGLAIEAATGDRHGDLAAAGTTGALAASPAGSPVVCRSTARGTPAASPAAQVTVKMTAQLRFEPARLTIRAGESVIWMNEGAIPHTTTDDPARNPVARSHPEYAQRPNGASPWDSGLLQPGQTFSHTFLVPGEYHYFCIPHVLSGMRGTVVVTC